MVAFDASILIDVLNPKLSGVRKLRIDLLLKTLAARRQKVIVPAPAYSEFLIGAASARGDYQKRIAQSSVFRIAAFDEVAALECALLLSRVFSAKEQRSITRTKIKFDWMIVSIAKTTPGLTRLYAGDADIARCATHAGVESVHVDDLPVPAQSDWVDGGTTPTAGSTPD